MERKRRKKGRVNRCSGLGKERSREREIDVEKNEGLEVAMERKIKGEKCTYEAEMGRKGKGKKGLGVVGVRVNDGK